MKAKTMLGLIACASACVSLSAFANTTNGWFGVTVADTEVTPVNVTTNGVGTVSDSKINLNDIEQNSALVFTPRSGSITNCTDDIYVIGANVVLTPCSTNDFRDVDVTGAKAGVVAGFDDQNATNYYGYAGGEWIKLEGVTVVAPGEETEFYIVLNYRDNVASFVISKSDADQWCGSYPMSPEGASSLANIKVWGTGSISSVTGAFEVAVAAYDNSGVLKKYGSIAEASDAATKAGAADPTAAVQVVNSDGTTEEPGATAENGLSEIVCKALGLPMNDPDANIAVAPAATDTEVDKITLAVNVAGAPEASAVRFGVTPVGGGETIYYDDASAIKIPLTAGTYTITPVLK